MQSKHSNAKGEHPCRPTIRPAIKSNVCGAGKISLIKLVLPTTLIMCIRGSYEHHKAGGIEWQNVYIVKSVQAHFTTKPFAL